MHNAHEATSPKNNESFDALIDLLGSDDVVEDPRFQLPSQSSSGRLRDTDGNLHLGKIHSFFSSGHNDGDRRAPVPYASSRSERGETYETGHGASSHSIVNSTTKITGTTADLLCPQAQDPTGKLSPPIEELFNFGGGTPSGISPGTSYISRSNASSPKDDLPDSSIDESISSRGPTPHDNLQNEYGGQYFNMFPEFTSSTKGQGDGAMELEALTQALRLANSEVIELRRQCDDLRNIVSSQDHAGNRLQNPTASRPPYNSYPNPGEERNISSQIPLNNPKPPAAANIMYSEVAAMSGEDAKQALTTLLGSLSAPQFDPSLEQSPSSISSVQRALDFVVDTDELIWRRSLFGSIPGGPKALVFDAENMTALSERLVLWERVVRGSRL